MMNRSETYAQERLHAPDFPGGAEWVNTERPLSIGELKGRVVILDFWTYCCINCMHILPDLAKLEAKYGDRLVVVGVHSAKFEGEKDTDNIRDAVRRYNIRHPVVNDAGFAMWRQLGVQAWPTLVLIDPEGYLVGKVSGEGNYEVLERAIGDLLDRQPASGLDLPSLPITVEEETGRATELFYPGKVIVDAENDRLFVADSGHNRIVVADPESGEILVTIGSGEAGLRDGGFSDAAFANPQGMALDGSMLYIADTDNHALRAVDLEAGTVTTISGDGSQARWGARGGTTGSARLNSPWDLVMLDGVLYIAMAGPHQLWSYDPASGRIGVFAGSGKEDIDDGSFDTAALAQPSGITTDGIDLYFADSETSSIRKASVREGTVTTLIGTGLFDFGHRDGAFSRGLLQHPLGVVWAGNNLWVADTYNNRVRKMNLEASTISTIAGGDDDGLLDGVGTGARFDEPGGIAWYDGALFIADTNNHAIRTLDTNTGTVATLTLRDVVKVAADNPVFDITVVPPKGFHVNEEAPSEVTAVLRVDGNAVTSSGTSIGKDGITASFTLPSGEGETVVEVSGDLYVCNDDGNPACYIRSFSAVRTLRLSAGYTPERPSIRLIVTPPQL